MICWPGACVPEVIRRPVGRASEPRHKHYHDDYRLAIDLCLQQMLSYHRINGMEIKNTLLDDLCTEIGYTATTVISAWYGRDSLYIPTSPHTDNHLHRLIGKPAFERLVKAFPGMQIRCVPKNAIYDRTVRWREVYNLLLAGTPVDQVCEATSLTQTHVINIRRELEDAGLLPLILRTPKE